MKRPGAFAALMSRRANATASGGSASAFAETKTRLGALVSAKQEDDLVPLYDRADAQGALVARLQPGVLATVKHCSGTWCHISGTGFDGWMVQERLWGVYPNEKID